MSDIFGKLKTGAGKVAFEADKLARAKREELEIVQLKKQIEGLYTKLGDLTYQSYISGQGTNPETPAVCQNITDLMQKIAVNEEDIRRINAEVFAAEPPAPKPAPYTPNYAPSGQAPPPPPPQAYSAPAQTYSAPPPPPSSGPGKFCSSCGRPNTENARFCAECGAKIA